MIFQYKHLGFTLKQRQNRQHLAITLANTDFVGDIVMLSDMVANAEALLHRVDLAATEIGAII